ncbi:Hsp70 family protein [Pseudonocardia adelaidensis]|uniref:Molecular chaperone DnaK n=1 Tax=Pseudonocardia adelaidensis TaxID=648754 RepID=A0ABP9NER6_9PSEU
MTRQTIDVGIDLGTTTSCVAVMGQNEPQIVRNNLNEEFTPSAVAVRKAGEVYVGRRAKERLESDPDNAQAEFKRYMGFEGWSKTFTASGRTFTAPQLSAEVLKTLRQAVEGHLNEPVDAAVITIPAAFEASQRTDTITAARMAGFGTAELLQEPIAAAFAYSSHYATERAFWLVYDLGGGTFDAALVRLEDGQSTIVNHAGDNYLGGTRIDWDIVDEILMPAAAREFGLSGFRRDESMDPRWRANVQKLKMAAEQLKIDLSVHATAYSDVVLNDLDGTTLNFEASLAAGQLHEIAMRYYRRTIELCRKTLAEAGVRPDDVDKVLLVGGSTLAPTVRELIADPEAGLGIEIDGSLDPITVVARGAALYAASRPTQTTTREPTADEVVVDLRYELRSDDPQPPIGGKARAASARDWSGYQIRFSDPSGVPPWTGPMVPLTSDGDFFTELFAQPDTTTEFRIELFDPRGSAVPVQPATATYRHTSGPVPENTETLRRSIGLAMADGSVMWSARKGATLDPKSKISTTHDVRTTEHVSRSGSGVIRIPIVEGERARADRNAEVGTLVIRPTDITRDVPVGTPVEVTVDVTAEQVTASAYVPLLDRFWDTSVPKPSVPDLDDLRERQREAEERRQDLRRRAENAVSPEPREMIRGLESSGAADELGRLSRTGAVAEPDRQALDDRLHEYEAHLDAVEDVLLLPEVRAEVDGARADAAEAVRQHDDQAGRQKLETIDAEVERATAAKDVTALRRQIEELHQLEYHVLNRSGQFHPQLFRELTAVVPIMTDQREARMLVSIGQDALNRGDNERLAAVNASLLQLVPEHARPTMPAPGDTGHGATVRAR